MKLTNVFSRGQNVIYTSVHCAAARERSRSAYIESLLVDPPPLSTQNILEISSLDDKVSAAGMELTKPWPK